RRGRTIMVTAMVGPWDGSNAAQLDWWFTISDGKISRLVIERSKPPNLPVPVACYVEAANTFVLGAMLEAFADDAVVNDRLQEYRGKTAIRNWAARDMIADRVTLYVVKCVERYEQAIVTANVDGDYDKSGLPDPLVLTFYFSVHEGKIVQLI